MGGTTSGAGRAARARAWGRRRFPLPRCFIPIPPPDAAPSTAATLALALQWGLHHPAPAFASLPWCSSGFLCSLLIPPPPLPPKALCPDDGCHELVPGSHREWRTDFQYDVLRRLNGNRVHTPIPGAVSIRLKRGEALLRSGVTIHRGNTRADSERLTLVTGWARDSAANLAGKSAKLVGDLPPIDARMCVPSSCATARLCVSCGS